MFNSVVPYEPGFRPISLEDLTGGVIKLTSGVYNLVYNDFSKQYELVRTNNRFKLPNKIYGKAPTYATHFLEAYKKSDNNLGVILTGEKGTGKTELTKLIANMAIDSGYPVVTIYDVQVKEMTRLIEFVESLGDVIIILDEFGKNFSHYDQDKLLPLLSSSSNGKKMFLITENNYYAISNFIRSRPGRARYHIDFQRLEPEVVQEYLEDKMVDKKFKNEILNFYNKSARFTFDYLRALVEEHQLFPDKDFKDLVKVLNIDELKKKYYIVVKNVYKLNEKDEREATKYEQAQYPLSDNFKSGQNLFIKLVKDVLDEQGNRLRKEYTGRIKLTIKDLVKINGSNYLFKVIDSTGKYEIEAEEMDEDKKKELLDRNLIPIEDENPPTPPMFV